MNTPRPLRVVIVAFHAADELDRSLHTLGTAFERTVVDNSSSPSVREVAARRSADYVDPGENLGFAAGVNAALRPLLLGEPRDVLLLNPDAAVDPESVKKLATFLHRDGHDRYAAVAPKIVDSEGMSQRVLWPFPSPARAWMDAAGLGRRPAARRFAIGAVLLLRWEALLDVGLFDERFFLYAEEADWQRRAVDLGWQTALCQDAVAVHTGAGASGDPIRREVLFHAGQETYVRKWHGTIGWSVYRVAAIAGAIARSVVLPRARRSEAARRAALYAYGPRRRAGFSPRAT
ncbi:MAG: glycosyltransferase family 2 protein [Gaiellaceae bacterium]